MPTILSSSYLILSGLNLSNSEDLGVEWITTATEGIEGSPASTIKTQQKPRSAGSWAGDAYTQERDISISGIVTAPTREQLADAINRLNQAVTLGITTLVVTIPGQTLTYRVRRNGEVLSASRGLAAEWSLQLVAPDPRKFGAPLTGSTRLPASSGGLAVPFAVPFAIGAVSVSGQVTLFNGGNETGPVTLRIDGPVNGPSVTHIGSGRTLTFSSALVLGAGEWIDIDMEARTVLANGQSSRSGYVTSRGWSNFEPGSNTWSFTATSFTAGALLTVTAFPAFK